MQQEDLIGTTLGQYQILDELGRGGMAVVYKAWQPSLQRYVALKVLLPYLGGDPEFIQRFQQEAIVAANLNHPHIVTIYEVGQQDGRIFIAMEYVEGTSLEQLVLNQGALPLERTIRILRQVAEALDYAHKRRFLHRDIKPANILMAEDDRVVITDFGIAKALEGSGATARLTSTGTMLGTPAYMSPEQIQGLAVDHRSDLYAFGIVAYEMLSGQVPFDGTTTALLYAQVNQPPPAITRFAPGLPTHVEWVITRMLAKQPDERFTSAGEFVGALASGGVGVSPARAAASPPRFPTPPPQNATAVMPPGMSSPQAAPSAPPQPYGAQGNYGYLPTQAAPPQPYGAQGGIPPAGYGYPQADYAPPVSPWAEPAPVKKKRAVWPWLLGGGLVLGIMAVAVVLGYLFLNRDTSAKLLEEGQTALEAQDYTAAQSSFEEALQDEPQNAAAQRGLGWTHYETGRYEDAMKAFAEAVRLEPENIEGQEGLGRSAYAAGRYEEALEPLKKWAELASQDEQAQVLLGEALFNLKRYAEAVDAYSYALKLQPSAGAYRGVSLSYYNLDQFEQALVAAEQWVKLDAQDPAAHNIIGWSLHYLRRYEEAVLSFSRSVELKPTGSAYRGLSNSYLELGQLELTLDAAQKWSEIEPDNADAYQLQGWALQNLGQNSEAVNVFSKSLELRETASAYSGLKESYSRLGKYEEGLEICEKWLGVFPDDVNAHVSKGWLLFNLKRYDEAINVFSRSLELQKTSLAYNGLGMCYYNKGDYEQALLNFRQWAALSPNDPNVHSLMGWSHYYIKQYQDALVSFSKSAELKENVSAYSGLSNTYMALNKFDLALEAALRWIEIAPADSEAHSIAGWVYVRLQNCPQAKIHFNEALQLNPQHKGASDGLKQCP